MKKKTKIVECRVGNKIEKYIDVGWRVLTLMLCIVVIYSMLPISTACYEDLLFPDVEMVSGGYTGYDHMIGITYNYSIGLVIVAAMLGTFVFVVVNVPAVLLIVFFMALFRNCIEGDSR